MSSRQAERLHRLRREKRGVVLLVVVSILTLFLMVGVTYVLIAGHYHDSSKQNQRAKRYGDEAEREMEEVISQVLFGNLEIAGGNGPRSVIGPHSLLADLYGNDWAIGNVANVANNPTTRNGGQTLQIQVIFSATAQPIPNYFAGRVITFTDGPAAGLSTRVMAYVPPSLSASGSPELLVEAPESDLPIPVSPSVNSRFIINGAPFNGSGAGWTDVDVSGNQSQNLDGSVQLNANNYFSAYLPNYLFYPPNATTPIAGPAVGGLDEQYDTPDYQNMFLAMVPPIKLAQLDGFPLLPSYHRPDLVRFWIQTLQLPGGLLNGLQPIQARQAFLQPYGPDGIPGTADDPLQPGPTAELIALKRMMILRPLREDHPNFTGGNQNFLEDNLQGPYDVDNDGDGISDSIWVDAGLPVVTAANGRRYKRLVAILIKDLDGRVNPNVHGNLAQVDAFFQPNANPNRASTTFASVLQNYPPAFPAAPQANQVTLAGRDMTNPGNIYLPRGLGFGPAEVDFRHIFGDDDTVYNSVLLQRYFTTSNQDWRPGISDPMNQNNPLNDDGWSRLRTIGMPTDHTSQRSIYSTPPDVWGRAAMAVDYTGQPLWTLAGTAERLDDAYEVQWDQLRASADAPYTVSELEALLRYHDLGAAAIPSRLLATNANGAGQYLAMDPPGTPAPRGTPGPSQVRRNAFGMGSYIPVPKMVIPRELRAGAGLGNSPTLLALYDRAVNQDNTEFRNVVPFEFLKGQLFNLNRELGNGIDDNGNGVVDEPAEFWGGETIPTTDGQRSLNYFNDSPPNANDQRQLYARHLYCLMMLVRNQSYQYPLDVNQDGMINAQDTARYFAQWAINAVDFRDADSIMTPFEYDENPFQNGWNVDGILNTAATPSLDDASPERGLVWGCERPELLISETVNFHARKTEDRPDDNFQGMADNGKTDDPAGGEKDSVSMGGPNDFDQRLSPEGSTFIELYNPWFDRSGGSYDHKPAELYNGGGVNLARLHNGASGSPVWRMIVVSGTNTTNVDPDQPRPEALAFAADGSPLPPAPGNPAVERSIYFANLEPGSGVTRPSGDGEAFFPSSAIPRAPVLPGRYAVVGSAGYANAGSYTTVIGRRTTDPNVVPARPDYANTRRIILTPNANPNASPTVQVRDNLTDGADDANPADFQPIVALPVDMVIRPGAAAPQPQSLNISEPVGGYPGQPGGPPLPPPQAMSMWVAPTATEEGYYDKPLDTPLDGSRTDGGEIFSQDRTRIKYRDLHLQRLANPLLQWDPVSNPYLTVDSSSMDVMSFNGVTAAMDPSAPAVPPLNFQAFQRGGRFYDTDMPEMVGGYSTPVPVAPLLPRIERALWPSEINPSFNPFQVPSTDSPTENTANAHYQTHPLYHTLGHINRRYQPYFGAAGPNNYLGAPYFQDTNGTPLPAFAWLTFLNRPFTSPLELLQVPTWQSSQLLRRFDGQYVDPANPSPTWVSMYQPPVPPDTTVPYAPHLLNFFHTSSDPNNNSTAPEISRLLDYVETRTPYTQTEKYYKPDAPVNFLADPSTPSGYRPPFNYLSRFREPGRININTIFDSNVWDAAVRGFPGMCGQAPEGDSGLFLWHLVLSRQGYGTTINDVLQHDPLYPSLFSQPFRTADSADMMPQNPNAISMPPLIPPQNFPRKSPADGGFLRRDPIPYPASTPPVTDVDRPLFASDNTLPYQDAARNPYFRYQGLQKVGNLFSTQSNCYAVWITMGYFEVEGNDADNDPATPFSIDPAHPDGLRLAQEVGVDTGEVKRHRAFYIIDRSIPVGYEPGHRHNTDKAVLLKRFIE